MARREDEQSGRLPLPLLYSVTIPDTCERTGWSLNRVYDEIGAGHLDTYNTGRRRFVLVESLLRRLDELRAQTEPGLRRVPGIH
jgi:hypothetical protein